MFKTSHNLSKRSFIASLIATLVFMFSCESGEGEPSYPGYEYFGLQQGNYIIYQVDSIRYDDFLGEVFEYQYQVKEWNKELFVDSQGEEKMRIERFYRKNEQEPWQIKDVWTAMVNKTRALKTEDNITFVKLVFPTKKNNYWDGNSFNTLQRQEYKITQLHQPYLELDIPFDSTLTVLQQDFTTLIGEDYQYEIYATGVGMISKKYVSLEKEIDGNIIRGVDYSYRLIGYGNEVKE